MSHETSAQMIEKDLLPNDLHKPGASGWFLTNASFISAKPDGSAQGVQLHGMKPTPRALSCATFNVRRVPVLRELKFSCMLRGTRLGQKLKISAYGFLGKHVVFQRIEEILLQNHNQLSFVTTYVLPSTAREFGLRIDNLSAQPAFITEPALILGEEAKVYGTDNVHGINHFVTPNPSATKVISATYKACARALTEGEEGTITFPIPGPYRNQVPLTFEIETKPKSAFIDYSIQRRDDQANWTAAVRVKPPYKGVVVTWKSLVLISGATDVTLPEATLPETKLSAPSEQAQWLAATKCVQSDSPDIIAKASDLAAQSNDLETYVRKVIEFTSTNQGTGEKYYSLDAQTALERGGSCTSRANLAAALLRAQGIPARTVAHLPAWHQGPLFEHWLVEYWHSGVGWIWVEPTLNRFLPAPNELVILAVSNPDDEDLADDPIHLRYIAPGAAYLSGCELSSELEMARIIQRVIGPNTAIEEAVINGTPAEMNALFEAANKNFSSIAAQYRTRVQSNERMQALLSAAQNGSATKLRSLLSDCV